MTPQFVSTSVLDSTGVYPIVIDGLPQVLTYAGPSGAISSILAGPDSGGFSYRQTFGYTGSNVTSISGWVKQ